MLFIRVIVNVLQQNVETSKLFAKFTTLLKVFTIHFTKSH